MESKDTSKEALKEICDKCYRRSGCNRYADGICPNIKKVWNDLERLEKYEKLEKELGCPLNLVLIPYFISGLKKVWYHKQWCDVVRVVAYEEATKPYMEVRCKDYKYLKMIFLEDYKNTFWLKEDKSE